VQVRHQDDHSLCGAHTGVQVRHQEALMCVSWSVCVWRLPDAGQCGLWTISRGPDN
jgi:hypothetical protein